MSPHQWISDLGLPVGLIAVGAYFAWRIAHFCAPLVTDVAEKHCELIDTLKLQSTRQTQLIQSQNAVLNQHGNLLHQIHLAVHNEEEECDESGN